MPMNQALLAEFDIEMKTTRKALERIPAETFGWKPHEKSGTMGWLAWHVASLPLWAKVALTTDVLDFTAPLDFKFPEQPKTTEELVAIFDSAVIQARNAIESATDESMMKTWTLKQGDRTIFTAPRAGVMRGFFMSHLIHHRGQLTVYMRLKEISVPPVYGPSADENPWEQAEKK